MTDPEFAAYLDDALDELERKQDHLTKAHGLGSFEKFVIDYEREEIRFSSLQRPAVIFEILAVGSHVPKKESWQWAWANHGLPEPVRRKSSGIQQLYDLTGFDIFKQETTLVDESMAWEFVALACKTLNAQGAYSTLQNDLRAYVLLTRQKPD